ncbi:ABC transporter permease [Ornithinibacillus sp. BX22]|uniref:ABC transporter permease n=1 Tax=Ornithinibacillus hominis TaxID=2763055 RepID=A0A923RJR8_9BACI|nr:ABC transporter permease [Ornithinibacillus hominis]MBC5636592.1 ABC transporter permease [Ornithinibacillus hominis]
MKLEQVLSKITFKEQANTEERDKKVKRTSVFGSIVRKEFTDYIRSWRIIILLIIIGLTCLGSLYTAITTIKDALDQSDEAKQIAKDSYLFLKLFTTSDGTLPPFITFVTFLGPLLGVALGFDAINSERNKGTLTRLMAQPIPRDYVINAKFVAALLVNVVLFFALGFLVMALGIIIIGLPITFEEFIRIVCFLVLCIVYIAFWLNLGILFSVRFKQAATSALSGIAVWIFFSIFYNMIIDFISKSYLDSQAISSVDEAISRQETILNLYRLSPSYLFSESTTTLLSPGVRTLGPLTMEQTVGAIAGPLPLGQSLLLIWPQLTGLIAATLICFIIAYNWFIKQEIRTN